MANAEPQKIRSKAANPKVSAKQKAADVQLELRVIEAQRDARAVLQWLENRKDGRAYIGHLLMRIHGLSAIEKAAFRKAGGLRNKLSSSCEFIKRQGFTTASCAGQSSLSGAVISEINRTGAEDILCPAPLRNWLRHKKQTHEDSWGVTVAVNYWPGRSPKRKLLRAIFAGVAAQLALSKDLADRLIDRDAPRLLARALVNRLLGYQKIRDFNKSAEATRNFISNLCADTQHGQWVKLLQRLLIEKCVRHERKDVPAKRLKEAVADQFRIWRLSRYPTPEHFAKEAVDSTSPWAMEKLTSLSGQ
jgi:hypothetical protein